MVRACSFSEPTWGLVSRHQTDRPTLFQWYKDRPHQMLVCIVALWPTNGPLLRLVRWFAHQSLSKHLIGRFFLWLTAVERANLIYFSNFHFWFQFYPSFSLGCIYFDPGKILYFIAREEQVKFSSMMKLCLIFQTFLFDCGKKFPILKSFC